MLAILTYISYSALAIHATPAFNEMNSITGGEALQTAKKAITNPKWSTDGRVALPSAEDGDYNPYTASVHPDNIPELYDIPIGMVNSVLYHKSIKRARAKAQARGANQCESSGESTCNDNF